MGLYSASARRTDVRPGDGQAPRPRVRKPSPLTDLNNASLIPSTRLLDGLEPHWKLTAPYAPWRPCSQSLRVGGGDHRQFLHAVSFKVAEPDVPLSFCDYNILAAKVTAEDRLRFTPCPRCTARLAAHGLMDC